ncbi:MAG: DinB family protein [Actinomycetota bacterium]|nr:DinB family protein [Actinomycetota bacterium]
MEVNDVLHEMFDRLPGIVRRAVDGLGPDQLASQPADGANSIAWLIWHLARVQDGHIAELIDEEQVWVTGAWAAQFGLSADPSNTGYGHDAEEAAAVRPEGSESLVAYYDAMAMRTMSYLANLDAADLDRVVDDSWDPPVTLGARLISVASDDLQHAGQAGYARGLLEREAQS